jgi:uncharacterized protein YerC
MKRYHFLSEKEIIEALDHLKDAFLSAKNAREIGHIIDGLLTHDEKMKIGRRIIVAKLLDSFTSRELVETSRFGRTTLSLVSKLRDANPEAFNLILKRKNPLKK